MNINSIKQIYKFNKEAGLLDNGYDDRRESCYPIEEMLETFVDNDGKLVAYKEGDMTYEENVSELITGNTPKEFSRILINLLDQPKSPHKVDLVDKHIDSIVFSFGSLFKLGLTPQDTMTILGFVMDANLAKLTAPTDDQGKQTKPDGWVGPEERIEKFLKKQGII